jgi:type I restriction enzyme M protein
MMKCLSAARVLDIFWSKDKSLEDSASLSDPGLLALEIAEELEATRERFAAIAEDLKR